LNSFVGLATVAVFTLNFEYRYNILYKTMLVAIQKYITILEMIDITDSTVYQAQKLKSWITSLIELENCVSA
jgi:hypothetical protein